MSFQVTARKWRPMVFEDVVGQRHVTATLKNALSSGRVAHAYIFSGTRGSGKTTTARILAKAVNCLSPIDHNPDNTCEVCQEIVAGRSMDVIEIDGASNRGVEEIRNLRESVRYAPARGKYKIYIIDEVHMLTKEAFNALLKTLEEPPSHVIFVFATTEIHKVPMTILSRCQRFDFRRIATEEIVERLRYIAGEEQVQIEEDALNVVARKGDGSMRDAQSIFDQVRAFCGSSISTKEVLTALNVVDQELYFRCSAVIRTKDAAAAIGLVDEVVRSGYDLREFVGGLAEHFRHLLIVAASRSTELIEMSASYKKRYEDESAAFPEADLLRILKIVHELEQTLRFAPQPRYKLESTMLQLARLESAVKVDDLLKRLEDLRQQLKQAPSAPPSTSASASAPAAAVGPLPTSEVRVIGSVSAGPMSSPAAMKYSTFFGKPAWNRSTGGDAGPSPTTAPASPSQQTSAGLTAAMRSEIAARWQEVVVDVLKKRIAIGTTLSESEFLDVENGAIRIGCRDEYHLTTLRQQKEYLSETVLRVLGVRVTVEPVMHGSARPSAIVYSPAPEGERKSVITTSPSEGPSTSTEIDPLIAALQRDLGAERVD
ncbi:MAG: DNA polymerase III subunit gamma/tau [Bacteroidetes bacterium]|jgi:DNA polymerase-3 subunit gamma/tau|nr:DNA polymerase III subunit gamma/tau [Bacteroidota bacterium]